MSKARPHAHIYEKWVRGIRTAVPNADERCGLYEYVIGYQLAKVYNAVELPRVQDLSSAAAIALAMLEGDLDELCEARKEHNQKRQENGAMNIPSRTEQDQVGASRTKQDQVGPINTIQSNTIQSNTIQSNSNTMQDLANLPLGQNAFKSEFDFGLALLDKGYLVNASQLHSVYERATAPGIKDPVAYAAAAMTQSKNRAGLATAVNYLKATGCRDTRALEVWWAKPSEIERGVLDIGCAPAARDAITAQYQDKAREYLEKIGCNAIKFVCNG